MHNYKTWLLFLTGVLFTPIAFAQQVISTAGGNGIVAGYHIDFTVGETVIRTAGSDPVCTQGFLQPLTAKDYPQLQLNLRGTALKNYIQLDWTTASETSNKLFYIERSADGVNFEIIDSMPSKAPGGNSNTPTNYQYPDLQPMNGSNFYRLRQVSHNGNISYSETIEVKFAGEPWRIRVYPNPASNILYIKLYSDKKAMLRFYITAVTGQVISWKYIEIPAGYSTTALQVNSLAAGVYILSVRELFTGRRQNERFIKL